MKKKYTVESERFSIDTRYRYYTVEIVTRSNKKFRFQQTMFIVNRLNSFSPNHKILLAVCEVTVLQFSSFP